MKTRAIVLFLVVAIFVMSAALPALAGVAKPKPFHDTDFKNFGKIHVKYEICFDACHKKLAEAPHDLCGECHDVVTEAECVLCHD